METELYPQLEPIPEEDAEIPPTERFVDVEEPVNDSIDEPGEDNPTASRRLPCSEFIATSATPRSASSSELYA